MIKPSFYVLFWLAILRFSRVAEWLRWLFAQLEGPVYVDGWEDRDDCCHSQERFGEGLTDPCDSLRVSDFGTIAISRENLRNRLEWGECFKDRQLESFRQKTRS